MAAEDPEGPLVSCVIPTRDRWSLLLRALSSARAQEAPQAGHWLEILVVDDGSRDDTARLGPELPGVRYLRGEGRGAAAARNLGAARARGRWLAFLDDDDEWLPGKLHAQLRFAEEGRFHLTSTDWWWVDAQGAARRHEAGIGPGAVSPYRLLAGNPIATPTVMLERALFEQAGGFDPALRTAEDWDLWLRLAAGRPWGHLPAPWVRCHEHAGPRLTAHQEGLWRDALGVQERHLARLGPLPGPWEGVVRRARADARLRLGGAAWARRARSEALGQWARGLALDPLHGGRHLLRVALKGTGRR